MLLVAEPILGSDEEEALVEVVRSGWITMADRVRRFELEFAHLHAAPDCVAVNSCTAALHLILLAAGIGQGDEVLVPSLTFVASVNAIRHVGAKPVFVDIESLDTPIISKADAAAKCTARTRAIILVHYAGYVGDMSAWKRFAESHNLLLIEDAAHAPGAEQVGQFSVAAAFSFYGNKNMTTAEGGAVISSDSDFLGRVRLLRSHGLTSGTFERLKSTDPGYDVIMLGYNYRLDEFRAAVGLVQLRKLADWNKRRGLLVGLYRKILQHSHNSLRLPFLSWEDFPAHTTVNHVMPILLPPTISRLSVIKELRQAGIQTTVHYPPAHQLSLYRNSYPGVQLQLTEEFAARELTLPLHPRMDEDDVRRVAATLNEVVSKAVSAEVAA
jgi:dTDP-4-amino-4,6-dideoxygalactose transaminase